MKLTKTLEQGLTPGLGLRYALRVAGKARLIPESKQLELELVERPHYAYGLHRAAIEARGLGYSSVTAIEFGVAGGNGLLALEEYAHLISEKVNINIQVVGFDTGHGLPAPVDYGDLPHLWAAGDFDMDIDKLQSRLSTAELRLGLVAESVPKYLESHSMDSPIGFVSFDLDLWSSTVDAFGIFRGQAEHCLPRTWCYFDDIVETVQDVGELLAIDQFNEESHGRKIRRPYMLRDNVPFQPAWAEQLFQVHLFDNPRYTHLLTATENRNLPLRN